MADNYKQISSETLTKTRQKLEKPKLYKVILLNDDYTPMEYVVKLIKMVFSRNEEDAVNIMLMVHKKGSGVCGVYTKEIAETKVFTVEKMAKKRSTSTKMYNGARIMISDEFEKTLQRTQSYAKKFGHFYMTLEHLLLSLIDDQDVKKILLACSIDDKALKKELENFIKKNLKELQKSNEDEIKPTLGFQRVIQRAVIHVQSSGNVEANGANVLVALFSERESHAVYFLQQQNLTRLDVVDYISHGIRKEENSGIVQDEKSDESVESSTDSMNNFLEKYCVNLNKQVIQKKIDPIIGRVKEIERTIHILSRRNKNNPIFVGDPGVGKTALAEGLAFKIVNGEVPESILHTTIYSLDLGGMLAGTKFRGDFEDRLKKLINFFEKNSNFILFIDEIHTLIGAGGTTSGSMDASNILKPALSKGKFKMYGIYYLQ